MVLHTTTNDVSVATVPDRFELLNAVYRALSIGSKLISTVVNDSTLLQQIFSSILSYTKPDEQRVAIKILVFLIMNAPSIDFDTLLAIADLRSIMSALASSLPYMDLKLAHRVVKALTVLINLNTRLCLYLIREDVFRFAASALLSEPSQASISHMDTKPQSIYNFNCYVLECLLALVRRMSPFDCDRLRSSMPSIVAFLSVEKPEMDIMTVYFALKVVRRILNLSRGQLSAQTVLSIYERNVMLLDLRVNATLLKHALKLLDTTVEYWQCYHVVRIPETETETETETALIRGEQLERALTRLLVIQGRVYNAFELNERNHARARIRARIRSQVRTLSYSTGLGLHIFAETCVDTGMDMAGMAMAGTGMTGMDSEMHLDTENEDDSEDDDDDHDHDDHDEDLHRTKKQIRQRFLRYMVSVFLPMVKYLTTLTRYGLLVPGDPVKLEQNQGENLLDTIFFPLVKILSFESLPYRVRKELVQLLSILFTSEEHKIEPLRRSLCENGLLTHLFRILESDVTETPVLLSCLDLVIVVLQWVHATDLGLFDRLLVGLIPGRSVVYKALTTLNQNRFVDPMGFMSKVEHMMFLSSPIYFGSTSFWLGSSETR